MKRNIKMDGAKGKFDISSVIGNILSCAVFYIAAIILVAKMFAKGSILSAIDWIIVGILVISGIIIISRSFREHGRDNMTRLPNQAKFTAFAVFKMLTKKFPQYTVAFINLKDQKYVNRVVGKGNGDYIITEFAHRLNEFMFKGEIAARLGGDNFIVLVYKHRVDELITFLSGMQVEYLVNGIKDEITVHARAGLYSLEEKDSVDDVFTYSSIALAFAKSNKTDFVWYTQEMAKSIEREKEITYSFDDAIKNEEFVVYYQPKVDLTNNKMCATEALARWLKDGRLVPPMEFIPVLEQNRLVQKLDFYVLEHVCKDMISWRENGIEVMPVSVNFSKYHLYNDEFAKQVISIIGKYGLEKELFQVELTETADYSDNDRLLNAIKELHEEGIGIAIDDFGKGYSSPEHLKNPDIDIIKFDRSFVNGIELNGGQNRDAALVRNLIATCKELKKKVVFEGIETLEQKEVVKQMQCDYIQGYYYDRPMSETDIREKLVNSVYNK